VWGNLPDVLPVCVLAGVGQPLVVRHELAESARSCNNIFENKLLSLMRDRLYKRYCLVFAPLDVFLYF
jgi:hypothetical protein